MELTIRMPQAHPKQREFIESSAKRKVIVAGRRGGKTTGDAMLATKGFLDGHRVLYAAPTQEQTDAFWSAIREYLKEPIEKKIIYKNETLRLMEFGKSRIRAKTAWNADTLRGDHADLLILEEWSLMDKSAWDEVGAPMLLDNNGDAVFTFTPKRRNHAYQTYLKAQQEEESGRWQRWHFTSFDNPFLSKEALAEITQDMTEDAYRQEIMAEFLEGEGAVFRKVREACVVERPDTPDEHQEHSIVAGVDWGKQNDFTRIRIFCRECSKVVDWDGFNKIDYSFQRDRLKILCDRWRPQNILAESNSIGEPNIEMLRREGLLVTGFETTGSSKPPLIESLALALERLEIRLPKEDADELEAYEMKINPNSGRPSYSAPEGIHDDRVIADALALKASLGSRADPEVAKMSTQTSKWNTSMETGSRWR